MNRVYKVVSAAACRVYKVVSTAACRVYAFYMHK